MATKKKPVIIRQGQMSDAKIRKIMESGKPFEFRFNEDGPTTPKRRSPTRKKR